jgi:hypothetical protein
MKEAEISKISRTHDRDIHGTVSAKLDDRRRHGRPRLRRKDNVKWILKK